MDYDQRTIQKQTFETELLKVGARFSRHQVCGRQRFFARNDTNTIHKLSRLAVECSSIWKLQSDGIIL